MSYTILYRPLFTKLNKTNRYIPIMECGDNNVYVVNPYTGRESRSRDWTSFNPISDKHFYTHEELVKCVREWGDKWKAKVQADLNGTDEWKRNNAEKLTFGWYEGIAVSGKKPYGTTFKQVQNMFLNGLENAVDFDFAVNNLCLELCYYKKENEEDKYGVQHTEHPKAEEEMLALYDSLKNDKDVTCIYFKYYAHSADEYYSASKAEVSFKKKNGGRYRDFVVAIKYRGAENEKHYLTYEGNKLVTTKDRSKAFLFNKTKSNGAELWDVVKYRFGSDVCYLGCEKPEDSKVA